jgi:hypothetical protein
MVTIFKLLFLLSISFTLNAFTLLKHEMNPQTVSAVKSIVSKVTSKQLKEDLKLFLKKGQPGRMVGTLGHKTSYEYIVHRLQSFGVNSTTSVKTQIFSPDIEKVKSFYQQDFNKQIKNNLAPYTQSYKRWKSFTKSVLYSLDQLKAVKGKNIIWEKKGSEKPNEYLILGVHYDTIAFDPTTMKVQLDNKCPGADDNGSGVIIALKLAKILSAMNIKRSVRVVFFDFQELGFNGSKAFVKEYFTPEEKWLGYINMEMLGHDSKYLDKNKKTGNMKLYIRDRSNSYFKEDMKFAMSFVKAGRQGTRVVDFKITPNSFNMSDHINFWPLGIPVIALTQDWENDLNPRQHSKDDFFETLNFTTLYGNYKFIASAVVQWARMIKVK